MGATRQRFQITMNESDACRLAACGHAQAAHNVFPKLQAAGWEAEPPVCTAATHEHRSIANMVEVLIRDYCGEAGLASLSRATCFATKKKTERGNWRVGLP